MEGLQERQRALQQTCIVHVVLVEKVDKVEGVHYLEL